MYFVVFKQKSAYEMRISDWSSDVCSSDLVKDPLLADPRLRRAIALSIDVGALTRVVTHGTGSADSSPIPTASPFFGAVQRPLIKRDLAAARALAKEAGYKGPPIRLATSHRPPEMYDAAILIQAMARDAGLTPQEDAHD